MPKPAAPITKQARIKLIAAATVDKKRFTFVVRAGKKEEQHRIRSRLEKVYADCLTNALNKALALNPGKKIVTTKYYTQFMDLISAKVEATTKSKQQRSTIFINVYGKGHKDEGDCYLTNKPDNSTQSICRNGTCYPPTHPEFIKLVEGPADNSKVSEKTLQAAKAVAVGKVKTKSTAKQEKELETKTTKIMEAKVKKDVKAAKVAKAENKKVTPKVKVERPVLKPGQNGIPKNAKSMEAVALAKEIEKGTPVRTHNESYFSAKRLKTRHVSYWVTVEKDEEGNKFFQQHKAKK